MLKVCKDLYQFAVKRNFPPSFGATPFLSGLERYPPFFKIHIIPHHVPAGSDPAHGATVLRKPLKGIPFDILRAYGITDEIINIWKDSYGDCLLPIQEKAIVKHNVLGEKNLNAATVFVNWFASKEGQEIYAREMLEPSLSTDVRQDLVPDYVTPRPGVKYDMDQYSEDWMLNILPKVQKQLTEALGR